MLVIEDDQRTPEVLATALVAAGHAVTTDARGADRSTAEDRIRAVLDRAATLSTAGGLLEVAGLRIDPKRRLAGLAGVVRSTLGGACAVLEVPLAPEAA